MPDTKFEDLPTTIGQTITGEPFHLRIEDSDLFHRATWLDRAYPEEVSEFPYDLVEGFLLLSMLDAVLRFATGRDDSTMWGLNYGLDKVRFVAPVRFGDMLVPTFETVQVVPKDEGFKVLRRCTLRFEASSATAMVADWWCYVLPRGTVGKTRQQNSNS